MYEIDYIPKKSHALNYEQLEAIAIRLKDITNKKNINLLLNLKITMRLRCSNREWIDNIEGPNDDYIRFYFGSFKLAVYPSVYGINHLLKVLGIRFKEIK